MEPSDPGFVMVFAIEGGNFTKAGMASSQVKKAMKQLNIDPSIIRRTVVALYEAEVNVVAHAYKGRAEIRISQASVEMLVEDEGPGIPDIGKAMEKGFSTASPEVREMGFGAGMGLPNIEANCDFLELKSTVGLGTRLKMVNQLQA